MSPAAGPGPLSGGPLSGGPLSGGPLSAVLAALEDGSPTLAAVARRTGLDPEVVRAAVDHLVRLGRLTSAALTASCAGGCGSCPAQAPGCQVGGGTAAGGRRALLLVRRPVRPAGPQEAPPAPATVPEVQASASR